MRLKFSFDTNSLVSFDRLKGELELITIPFSISPPYIATFPDLSGSNCAEAKGYHIRIGKTGALRLIPYGSKG